MKRILGATLALAAIGGGAYALYRHGHHGSLSGSRRRSRRGLSGPDEVRELHLFCDNDGDLYRQQRQPIEKNLQKKMAKGVFDKTKAVKLWGHLADSCAKKYAKQFGDGREWHKMFSTADRREVAKAFNESFIEEHGA
jgi:hypothetical protein